MLEASKIPGRFYRNSGPCDILSIALDTKEPPGRARGIGVNVPHKRAFTLSKEERLSMKKARSEMKQNALFEKLKKEIYPAVRKDVEESMMMQKTLTLTDSQQMGGEAGMEDAAYCATTLHKSSCASADPSDTETAAARDDAISDLSGMKDRLKGVLTHYEGTLKCATAWVCPPFLEDGLFLDNVPLKPGCVKCYVTEVKPGFNEFALKNVLGDFDEQRTLGETLLHHIQWPRKEIEFIDEIPEAPPRATTVAPQPVTLSLPQQLSRADASTCDQPARLCGVHAMSSSAPKQPVARPTTADDAPPVQMPAAEAAGGDPAAAHAQQTNLVEQTAKQSDASEPPAKQSVGPEPTAHQSVGPQSRDQHTNASALPAQQTNALARPPQHTDKLAPPAQKPDIASTHGQQSDASAPTAQQSVTAAPPAQRSGIDKPSAKQSVQASPSAR